MKPSELPYVDEHVLTIEAGPAQVWPALLDAVDGAFSRPAMAVYGRLIGGMPPAASGPRPLEVGSAMPGFRVAAATPPSRLILRGRHWFSDYALIFRLESAEKGRTRLIAESRALFPGVTGSLYRAAVIGSGGHVVGVRRLLAAVERRCERVG